MQIFELIRFIEYLLSLWHALHFNFAADLLLAAYFFQAIWETMVISNNT